MIFSKEVEKICAYCEHGKPILGTGDVLCKRRGIMNAASGCKHFLYTPLHRDPPPKADLPLTAADLPKIDE